jgi:RNA recognition motif-containing protein
VQFAIGYEKKVKCGMNIHVGNLSPETTLSALRGCFEKFGAVTDISISTYSVDGRFRSIGSVEMPSHSHGQAAIAGLQGKELGGAPMTVREEYHRQNSANA